MSFEEKQTRKKKKIFAMQKVKPIRKYLFTFDVFCKRILLVKYL